MYNGIGKYGSTCATHRLMVVRFSLSMLKRDDISPSKNQLTAISSIVRKNDCVVCLPMVHGKSLIFEIVPWYYMFRNKSARTRTQFIMLSSYLPLHISLMDKQVEDLHLPYM